MTLGCSLLEFDLVFDKLHIVGHSLQVKAVYMFIFLIISILRKAILPYMKTVSVSNVWVEFACGNTEFNKSSFTVNQLLYNILLLCQVTLFKNKRL